MKDTRCHVCRGAPIVVDLEREGRGADAYLCSTDAETLFYTGDLKSWRWLGGYRVYDAESPRGVKREKA